MTLKNYQAIAENGQHKTGDRVKRTTPNGRSPKTDSKKQAIASKGQHQTGDRSQLTLRKCGGILEVKPFQKPDKDVLI
ncbi:MAG: hypothetical protein ACP5D7_11510 [Limnospira sp.]